MICLECGGHLENGRHRESWIPGSGVYWHEFVGDTMITVKAYEEFVRAHSHVGLADEAYSVIGLCGEAGEVAEWYKKVMMRTKPTKLTPEDLKKELGDCQHYITRIALNRNWTIKEVMAANIEKLEARG